MDRESDVGSSENGSGRDTPRSLVDHESFRPDTPGPMPTYQYSKDELYEIQELPSSKVIPKCLAKEYMFDGVWDPERWHRGDTGSRGPSPLTLGDIRERRIERDGLRRASASASLDPKERLKEEKDGIVLSPQRRSFGTGCHVTHQPLLQRAMSSTVDYKDSDRDRPDRRDQRRIGSGRIQLDRGSERDRDFRNNRENDRGGERDFRNHREGDRVIERDFRSNRDSDRGPDSQRDYRGSRDPRDRFEREDRDRDRRYEGGRDRIFISRRDVDDRPRERDFRDFSNRHSNRRDRHDSMGRREEEPEWFSTGPISKYDTIELRGFEKIGSSRDRKDSEEKHEEVFEEEESHEEEKENDKDAINIADRNGSLETNESSSPETNQSDLEQKPTRTPPLNTLFDFNEFFQIDNIPGLNDEPVVDPELTTSNIGGSRFYQLFNVGRGNQTGSQEHSRRSSLNNEFGYLDDLLNGSKSPIIPSPPPPSANSLFDHSHFLTPFAGSDKQQNIEFGTVGQKMNNNPFVTALINNAASLEKSRNSPTGNRSTLETEVKLKALIFGNADSNPSSGTASPGFSSPLNVPGRVKTLAELEADLQIGGKPGPPAGIRRMTPPNIPNQPIPQMQRSKSPEENDLTAFNKLISLMKAGAATPMESPKMKPEERPMSPIQSHHLQQHLQQQQQQQLQHKPEMNNQFMQNGRPGPGDLQFNEYLAHLGQSGPQPGQGQGQDAMLDSTTAQKQFLQALQRNKEQQLQIRQAAIENMRLQQQQQQVSAGTPQATQPSMQPQVSQLSVNQAQVQEARRVSTDDPVFLQANTVSQAQELRRVSSGDPVMNFLKANPTIITKPASPTPPPQQPLVNIVEPPASTPRVPTPRRQSSVSPILQQAFFPQQTPGSPRVPSPIMFSQQPPMHLSAPSPIHPSQSGSLSQSPTNQPSSTNTTASIRPPSVPRVPSPQELVMHTQAILQNALIKKQLEDQKERFYKKQQERVKSPNPNPAGVQLQQLPQSRPEVLSSAPPAASMTPVSVAFTPTSVIRKMHSEKASEKEKQKTENSSESDTQDQQRFAPVKSISQDGIEQQKGDINRQEIPIVPLPLRTDVPPPMLQGMPPPPLPNQVLPNMISISCTPAVLAGPMSHVPPPPLPIVSTHLPPPPLLSPPQSGVTLSGVPLTNLVTADQSEAGKAQIRALMGQGSLQAVPVQLQNVPTSLQTPGRPILKGVGVSAANSIAVTQQMPPPLTNQQRPLLGGGGTATTPVTGSVDLNKLLQLQQQRQLNTSPNFANRAPVTPTTPYGIPLTGRLPLASTPVVGPVSPQPLPPATNPFLVQQMMQTGNPRGIGQISQLAAIQVQQQRMLDPRLQASIRPPVPRVVPQMLSPRNAINTPTPFNPRPFNPPVALQKTNVSAGFTPVSMVTALNGNNNFKQDANLMKWFGTDMLKTQLPNMPPLPAQGQRVMTVDEIERS